ncbi:hypothetical protein LPJ61_004358, partial [Coemansia biformis]
GLASGPATAGTATPLRAPGTGVDGLAAQLMATRTLVRVYTDDTHAAAIVPVGASGEQAADLDELTVCIHGRTTELVCMACTARSEITPAVLLKAANNGAISCDVCLARGSLADGSDRAENAFVRSCYQTDDSERIARETAQADADTPIDVLLVLGAAAGVSEVWAGLAEVLSEAATQTIVVGDTAGIPRRIAALGRAGAVRADEHACTQHFTDYLSTVASHDEASGNSDGDGDSRASGPAHWAADSDTTSASDTRQHAHDQACEADSGTQRHQQRGPRKARGRGRDKANLNHLLNFSLPARVPLAPLLGRPRRRAAEGAVSERQAEISRAVFINANFRFVLKPSHWATFMPVAHRDDMQLRTEWIERVVMPVVGDAVSCPICLSCPTAARITKCGHVFCMPCIQRHLSYGDGGDGRHATKCPVCWYSISGDTLLPVHLWVAQYDVSGADGAPGTRLPSHQHAAKRASAAVITMRLMTRLRGSTICLPRSSSMHADARALVAGDRAADATRFPWTFTEGALPFAKVVLAEAGYSAAEYQREICELQRARDDEEAGSESRLFIELALTSVRAALRDACTPEAGADKLEDRARATQTGPHDDGSRDGRHEMPAVAPSSKPAHGPEGEDEETDDDDDLYYFYQADDGQHIYMHPLHMRILAHDRGGYAKMPDSVELRARYSVESVITEEVRRRFRFLDHLSLRCEVVIVEPEIRGLVSRASADKFRHQLAQHDKQHAARARTAALDEARSELRAAATAAIQAAEAARLSDTLSYGALAASSPATERDGSEPDASNFPALGEGAPAAEGCAASGHGVLSPRNSGPLWPRQPLPGRHGNSSAHGELWEQFERAAAIGGANGTGNGADNGSEHDEDGYDDPEDFTVSAKDFAQQDGKKKKRGGGKGLKLVLSGASARRSR